MWGYRVLIGKRKGLIWGCKDEGIKKRISWCLGVVWTIPMKRPQERGEEKREEKGRKETHIGQHVSMLKTL